MQIINRVSATEEAKSWIRKLKSEKGELLFHQSGGCCDGSAPMCYPAGDFIIGANDVFLGEVEGVPVYMGGQQFEYWRHTHLILDLVPGRGASFSLEAPYGVRFLTRSRLLEESDYIGSA
ncbi:DUF779 domain-containing protein [Leptospira wolffii]|uniref:UDP-glucose 4-epimerase n=1 Tax=Leptospira wolffii TaxID=409998 RepID=A0A2M9ZCU8_9LEPT|nr:DUF779 domain-containing protein [Leptospira wolffii]PJZ66253.1 UDP-glucose 4-epimerase [Leptospira wolffii]TGK60192.1 DUF779 domain-containing protein [Leptospira wolffii]TGK72534.1 DUF779 domain-containing protein [Leptospira wolffii]TGK76199.1 DUF779 domain-containing protein [Leptospira wolffii]TGL30451.1 DUF779 domain-containing protein [Leptospira wolffii]